MAKLDLTGLDLELLNEVKEFYDPHPGFAGAAIPLPAPIKSAVDKLSGRKMTLLRALTEIRDSTPGDLRVDAEHGCVFLRLDGGGRYVFHMFRLIRFR